MKLIFILGLHDGLVLEGDTEIPSDTYKPPIVDEVTQTYRLVYWSKTEAWYIPQSMRAGYAIKLLAERAAS